MPFIRSSSDDAPDPVLEAFRKQVRTLIAGGHDPGIALIVWDGQPGISRDDLIDALKEETGEKPRPAPKPMPGAVQALPTGGLHKGRLLRRPSPPRQLIVVAA